MKTSETITKLTVALLAAQKAITFAAKDATNPHFKSKYANLESVIDAIKAPMNDNGIVFTQTFSAGDIGYLTLTTRLMHISGEYLEDTNSIPLQKNDAQGYGSAATYARRYALSAIAGLYQADDDGEEASKPRSVAKEVVSSYNIMPDDLEYLHIIIDAIEKSFKAQNNEELVSLLDGIEEQEWKVYVWSKLPSNIRSLIKKLKEAKK